MNCDHLREALLAPSVDAAAVVKTATATKVCSSSSSSRNGRCKNRNTSRNSEHNVQDLWMVCFTRFDSVDEEDHYEEKSDDVSSSRTSLCLKMMLAIILPALLWFQFAIVFVNTEAASQDMANLQFGSVQVGIVLFVLASCLYRYSLRTTTTATTTAKETSLVLLLLPEIITHIILVLNLFQGVLTAAYFMHFGTLVLAVNAVLNSCTCTVRILTHDEIKNMDGDDDDDDDIDF